jgi:phosphatidylinositol alpha 1,6-mannosyltransferase
VREELQELVPGARLHAAPARPIAVIGHWPLLSPATARRSLEGLLGDWRPQIIHAHTPWTLGRAALRAAAAHGIPGVLTLHILTENVRFTSPALRVLPPAASLVLRRGYAGAVSYAAALTAPTETAAAQARTLGIEAHVEVISNGVTELPAPGPSRTAGSPLLRLLYVGRLSGEKRIDTLIRALALLPEGCEVKLELVGDGGKRAGLERLASRLNLDVCFRGFLTEVELAECYQRADAFCMPSPVELECISALEALSFGLPVIAPAAGALLELATWSRGLLAYDDPGDPDQLAAQIALLASDIELRSRLSARGLEAIGSRSLDRVVQHWERLYAELIDAGPIADRPSASDQATSRS